MKIKCKTRTLRRWLASLLCVALLFSTVSVFGAMPKAKAASSYDGAAAARWAGQNYKGNYGKCAEFVSHCLRDGGGLSGVYSASTSTLYSQLKNSGLFTEYKMTLSGKRIHPTASANAGKIAVGDVLIVHNLDSPSTYPHTSIVQAIEGDYVYIAQRNPAMAKGDQYAEYQNYKTYDQNGTNYEILCMHYTGNSKTGDPQGRIESITAKPGFIVVEGWAFDWDDTSETPALWLYVDGEYCWLSSGTDDIYRPDVNAAYPGAGDYHGFSMRFSVDKAGTHTVKVLLQNIGGNAITFGTYSMNIPADTTGPEISNVQITNVTNEGYDISCTVTDNVRVTRVLFPTWTTRADGSADLPNDWNTSGAFLGKQAGNTWSFHVSKADHEGRSNFITDIRAYDPTGNLGSYTGINVNLDTEPPTLSNRTVYNVTSEGFDVSVVSTDDVGVDRVVVKAWTNDNDVVAGNATRNGDTYTYHVSISDHGNARGTYYVNMWAYDAAGNYRYFNSPCEVVVPEPDPILTFNANGGTAEFTTKQAERGAAYGALPEAWMNGYVFDGWYTDAVGGDRVSSSTVYTAAGHTTLYAHWIPVAADAAQGWALQDGTLIITVQGAMQDYTSARETPWFSNRADIRKIVVQNGVTSIGDYAFYGCENVTSVTLPGTVTQIGKLAFYGCKGLTSLELPESVAVVEDYAFAKASGLKTITFHGSAPLFGAGIFADVNADARCPAGDSSWTDTVRQSYTGSIRWSGVSEAELAAQTSELQLDDPVLESLLADSCV